MSNTGSVLLQFIQRPADWAAAVMIVFSIVKARNPLEFAGILIPLAFVGVILAAVPACVVFLVTNGDIRLLNPGLVGGWADRIAVGCDFLIPCFLIVVPSLLTRRLPWEGSGTDVQALVPAWLAIWAAGATAGLVITLHFVKGGQLADMRPTIIIAAVVGVVFLILPFYIALARACWRSGYRKVFAAWWAKQTAAWNFTWRTVTGHQAAAGPGEPDYLGDLLAALMLRHLDPDGPVPAPLLTRLREATRLGAATGTEPDEPRAAPLDKVLRELDDKIRVNAPAATADRAAHA